MTRRQIQQWVEKDVQFQIYLEEGYSKEKCLKSQ